MFVMECYKYMGICNTPFNGGGTVVVHVLFSVNNNLPHFLWSV